MAFQPKGSTSFSSRPGNSSGADLSDDLVRKLAEAVREKLISQGVPITPSAPAASPTTGAAPAASWSRLVREGADRVGNAGESPFLAHELHGDASLAAKIDHTLLKPDATREDIERVCAEARKYHFATVCVNSNWAALTAELLRGSTVKAIAVVGFPLGAASTASKAFEAREAIRAGCQEIDMVINIGAMKSRDYAFVLEDIRQVVEASRPYPVKVILETSNLNDDQKVVGCALSKAAGAAFVKTSTGFGSGGATAADIELMRRIVGPEMGVKASGGIRTFEDAAEMIAAGANRIGASASIAIVTHKAEKASKGEDKSSDKSKKPGKGGGDSAPPAGGKSYKTSLY